MKKTAITSLAFLALTTFGTAFVPFSRAGGGPGPDPAEAKKLQFYDYIREQEKRSAFQTEDQPQGYSLEAAALIGYDNNTSLDSGREGDLFHEETVDFVSVNPHPGWGPFGPGTWRWRGLIEFQDFFEEDAVDNLVTGTGIGIDSEIHPGLTLDASYDFKHVWYNNDSALNYFSHDTEYGLSVDAGKYLIHRALLGIEYRHYLDREALTGANTPAGRKRSDTRFEAGYELHIIPNERMALGSRISAVKNDSNDRFIDFNDYLATRFDVFFYGEFFEVFEWVGFGGFEDKAYESRVFAAGSDTVQDDDTLYLGSTVYYALSDQKRLFISYLYEELESNDANQSYSGSVIRAGFEYSI